MNVRDATARDAAAINLMICELAAYEDHAGELEFEVEQLVEALSGETPRLRAAIAESSDGPVRFFTYTIDFAIWTGGEIIRVDDIFVREQARGSGAGTLMMRRIAQLAIGRGATCRWEIEPDNVGARRFYRSIGVEVRDKKIGRWNRSAMLQLIEHAVD